MPEDDNRAGERSGNARNGRDEESTPDAEGGPLGVDRRRYMQALSAAGLVGAGAAGAAADVPDAAPRQVEGSLDAYHQTLRADLTSADRQQRQLPPGACVYAATERAALDAFSVVGGGRETRVAVDTDAVPITVGERVTVPEGSDDPADHAYRGEISDHSFGEGDLLLAVAYLRSDDDDAEVTARFGYEYTDSSGETATTDNFVQRSAHVEPSERWMRYYFPVEVESVPDSEAVPSVEFRTGYGEQTVEFGGLALFDYGGADLALDTLPPYHYEGRSLDAEWRDAAHDRIDEHRTADVSVEVVGPDGEAVSGASVDVEMTDHEFDFGSAVSVGQLTGDTEDDRTYREVFADNFNKATVENGLKYPAWEGVWDISNEATRAALEWLNERDYPVRGHYLLWEQSDNSVGGGMSIENPDSYSAEELEALIADKIRNHAAEFEEDVVEWDMHNHPVWQSNFRDTEGLGWPAVDNWWAAADETTDLPLHTNEMGAIGGQWQRSAYDDYIAHLVDNDYPIDAIGFMGHHQQQYNQILDIETMIEGYDTFAEYDLPMLVTEFDIQIFSRRNAQDVAVQADYTRDFLTVAFSRPQVVGVVSWGFWEEDHWRPTGAYYDADWSLRANGEVYRNLVFDEWWTDASGTTGSGPYQVDFVAGEVEEELGESEDDYYGRQNRLIQYAHTEGGEVADRDTWINSLDPETRDAVTASDVEVDDGTASVSFTVADGEELTLSLAAYTLPGGEFSFDTADEQELVGSATETFGPGDHSLEIDLPESGAFTTSAYLGDHEVTVSADGEETTRTVSVTEPTERTITVELEGSEETTESVDAEPGALEAE
ncbi:endo-1,4-beta-xylanase [Candidatus Halobonum tyrrellensis]|uniref:endo-1,4-beta-xylanase n=1 Tax=Candidatus Halobonum tyrrellensis G22 TaxID=1324957 RepID=V4IV81_9EURY|nr:endo-1,4-beta-xylanase [Candidatus Halobonum tyrrellensis]ESP87112.1 TonB-like protein [Candidatus Halobonum tyrrellensis G22]